MAVKFTDLEIFIAIVEAESISRAADNLGAPKSRLSRHLKELEEELGTSLMDRTTRRIRLTEAGQTFYLGAQRILDNMEALRSEVVPADALVRGRLSVFAPIEFISDVLDQHLGEFSRRHPALELEFLSGAARPDLLHDKLDVIIHPDVPGDSSLVAIKLCGGRVDYYASPAYLDVHGEPQHPSELYHHACIAELRQDRLVRPWLYHDGRETREARINPRYRCDSVTTARSLVEQGLGIAMLPVFFCEAPVREGVLVQLFSGQHQISHGVFAIYSSRRLKPRKLAVFLDFLREVLPEDV
jgi:DNA-binding transcriptional LysR family regulator